MRCRPGYVMDMDDFDGDVPPLMDYSRKRTLENEYLRGDKKRPDLKQIARARFGHNFDGGALFQHLSA